MADRVAPEVIGTLHHYGVGVRTDPTLLIAGHDERPVWETGRADTQYDLLGRAFYIEIKNGITGFDLTDWRDNQRGWAAQWGRQNAEYWLWLSLGIDSPTYTYGAVRVGKEKRKGLPPYYLPRRSWLVPYPVMIAVDAVVRPIQNTLVYRAGKGMRKEIQALGLDAPTLLDGFELAWAGSSRWSIPDDHPFGVMYLNAPQIPFLYEHFYGEQACPSLDPIRQPLTPLAREARRDPAPPGERGSSTQTVSSAKLSAMPLDSERPLDAAPEPRLAAIPCP